MKRLIAIVGLTLSVTAAALGCVEPCNGNTCEEYNVGSSVVRSRQPIDRDGVARIPYLVNASGQLFVDGKGQPEVSERDIIAAADLAARTWERATNGIDLIFAGTTDTPPQPFGDDDGKFVVGFFPSSSGDSYGGGGHDGRRPDIRLSASIHYDWRPCRADASRSCTRVPLMRAPTDLGQHRELQEELTYLFGGALGLGDVDALGLTMMTRHNARLGCPDEQLCRERSTLGAGDILGVRALYPPSCSTRGTPRGRKKASAASCGSPVVFSP